MNSKQKNSALILGFLLVFFCAYKFSIQKTFASKKFLKRLTKERVLLANAGNRIFSLQQENKYLDTLLNTYNMSVENSFQQTLLQKLNVFCERKKIAIISFNEPHSINLGESGVFTYVFTVKGNFTALVELTHYLEKQRLGEVTSVNFEKKKNYKTHHNYLICGFLLQKLNR